MSTFGITDLSSPATPKAIAARDLSSMGLEDVQTDGARAYVLNTCFEVNMFPYLRTPDMGNIWKPKVAGLFNAPLDAETFGLGNCFAFFGARARGRGDPSVRRRRVNAQDQSRRARRLLQARCRRFGGL